MATRPDSSGQTTRKQGNGLAGATLGFGIVGLIPGVLSPPALLLGFVAVVLGAGNLGRGRERLSSAGLGMTVAGLGKDGPAWTDVRGPRRAGRGR